MDDACAVDQMWVAGVEVEDHDAGEAGRDVREQVVDLDP